MTGIFRLAVKIETVHFFLSINYYPLNRKLASNLRVEEVCLSHGNRCFRVRFSSFHRTTVNMYIPVGIIEMQLFLIVYRVLSQHTRPKVKK